MTDHQSDTRPEAPDTRGSDSDERGTPAHVIRTLHAAIGGRFDLDPAAGAEPIEIADRTYTREDNGLAQPWTAETLWLNPPYSDPLPWMRKLTHELDTDHAPQLALVLVKADPTTTWFDHLAGVADYISLIDDRLSFHGCDGTPSWGTILAACGDVTDDVLDAMDVLGNVYRRETVSQAASQSRLGDLIQDGAGVVTPTAAPASPTAAASVSFDRLQAGDHLTVEFDHDRLGTVHGLPQAATVRVLPDSPSFNPEAGEIRVDCLGPNCLDDDRDLYLQVRERAYAATRTEVAVSVDGRPWELSSVDAVTTTELGVV